tara:strand:- start:1176 stop:1604 length:429 start_codon:yes stop_codon:yes gene_type:complete
MARTIKLKESDLTKIISQISRTSSRKARPRKTIKLSEGELARVVKRVMNERRHTLNEAPGVITHAMIQQCKHHLQNVPGTNSAWKNNFKAAVMGKPCAWIRNRYSFFGQKAQTATPGSGAYTRAKAKQFFLECLLGLCKHSM